MEKLLEFIVLLLLLLFVVYAEYNFCFVIKFFNFLN